MADTPVIRTPPVSKMMSRFTGKSCENERLKSRVVFRHVRDPACNVHRELSAETNVAPSIECLVEDLQGALFAYLGSLFCHAHVGILGSLADRHDSGHDDVSPQVDLLELTTQASGALSVEILSQA